MNTRCVMAAVLCLSLAAIRALAEEEPLFTEQLNVNVPHISSDPTITYDYDIVYVRAGRSGDTVHKRYYTDFSQPVTMEPGGDLMLLHPDGSEEVLVAGGDGSVTDPVVSYDGDWVYYSYLYNLKHANQWSPPREGADIFKIHLPTRRIVRLTDQTFAPNTGMGDWTSDFRHPSNDKDNQKNHFDYGVFNMGAYPLPGGRIVFTSNRDGFRPAKGYPAIALQLFVMDDSDEGLGTNLEKIGHLNISGALHPVALADGRIMFSTLESQGIRSDISWGIWTIRPDGTQWNPLISAFDPGGASNGFHFQTQLSDGSIVVEEYYNQNNSGFGAYIKLPPAPPEGYPAFGPGAMNDARNKPWRFGRFDNGKGKWYRMPFMPTGSDSLTPFTLNNEGPADRANIKEKNSPAVGKFTHPSGAPDNHMLTVYSPGPVNHQYTFLPQLDGGIYLVKNGQTVNQPADLRLIKNDPNYNECWPRAVVPYRRIHGIDEPARIEPLKNEGKQSRWLPEGTPFGLVGSSSLYKRESYPNGVVPEGKVTAIFSGRDGKDRDPWRGLEPFTSHGNGIGINWHNQGADAGLYENEEIVAVRILAMEPTTDRQRGARSGRRFASHANERLRVLGEIPVRKFDGNGKQPTDPDGNPDTSFLAKIPADTAFTFQTLDKRGIVLNMAQTWHQLRPGEIRTDCGGCHAHSQNPTDFAATVAGTESYGVWDLVNRPSLLTSSDRDQSQRKWDGDGETGVRYTQGVTNVEYQRDIRPILERSCVACHTKRWETPAGNLVLDADDEKVNVEQYGELPGTYVRLAMDEAAKFGHKPPTYDSWGYPNASRYIRKLQSRRSLLVWKIYGERLDGFDNGDHPSESEPGIPKLVQRGQEVSLEKNRHAYDIDYTGQQMPPMLAVNGEFKGPDGRAIRVEPLSDEDRRTIVRWIDLGCPIDLEYEPTRPNERGYGWMGDDNRPVLTVTSPKPGANERFDKIMIGMLDYYSGIAHESLEIKSSLEIAGRNPGENLAALFKPATQGVWVLKLDPPLEKVDYGTLSVSVRDQQGNLTRIERVFSVNAHRNDGPARISGAAGRSTAVVVAETNSASGAPPAIGLKNLSKIVEPDAMPVRVHVFEDYETTIEKKWWLRTAEETADLPETLSKSFPNRRAARAVETNDFDDLMGDPAKKYKAVVFNPVPGPPTAGNTHLRFRYKLHGVDALRVQLYSLSNGYHRHLTLAGLPQDKWELATVDMTQLRRPDGSGGPLSEDERIDDIQLYIDSRGELLIDDVVLYAAATAAASNASPGREPFPARILFTGWFDTGKQGAEWPGSFDIVEHDKPNTWRAARSVVSQKKNQRWVRVGLRGDRTLSKQTRLRFRYRLSGADRMEVVIAHSKNGNQLVHRMEELTNNVWEEETAHFDVATGDIPVDEIRFLLPAEGTLLVDDLLLYEPGE